MARHSPISQSSSPGRRVFLALHGPSATRTRTAAKRALSGPLVPLRQVMRCQRCVASISAAESGGRLGTGCLAARPLGVYAGRSLSVGRIDKLSAGDTGCPGQLAFIEPMAEVGAAAETGI